MHSPKEIASIRARLKQGAIGSAGLDREIAEEWSAVDQEAWQRLEKSESIESKTTMSHQTAITFQIATTDDAEMLVGLEQKVDETRLYGAPLDIEGAREEIRKNVFYFIRFGDTVVGTAAYRVRPDNSAYISNVAISPSYRGQGIARAAMTFILDKIQTAKRIELVTHPENFIALKSYTSLGFEVEGRKENYYGDGQPRLILAKTRP